jgi:hypothetical protein
MIAQLIALVLMPTMALAQQKLINSPESYERDYYKKCKSVDFGDEFVTRKDINNDGLEDVIINHGSMICDGEKGVGCNGEGCPYNFYLQVKEGGYFMIATAQLYGYDFIKRFGNMVFVFKMHPKYCDRTSGDACQMTVRVRGAQMMTISKK